MRTAIPLSKRPLDLLFVVFFVVNLGFITYIVDIEQLLIADAQHFRYPPWPPARLVDLIHWWGRNYDPLLLARPPFWKATIWIDALLFGPFYACALHAYVRARDWIRVPSLLWAATMMTNVTIIMAEEIHGAHATPRLLIVTLANAPWFLVPLLLIARLYRSEHPFTRPITS